MNRDASIFQAVSVTNVTHGAVTTVSQHSSLGGASHLDGAHQAAGQLSLRERVSRLAIRDFAAFCATS